MKQTICRLILVVAFLAFCWGILLHVVTLHLKLDDNRRLIVQTNRQAALRTIEQRKSLAPCDVQEWTLKPIR